MADQLQEMLQKIYDEGVNKAKAEADRILEAARQQSDQHIKDAEAEAQKIIANAQKQAEELDRKLHSDLKMAAQQALSAFKNKVVQSVLVESVDKQANQSLNDTSFLQKLILEILGKWSPQSSLVLTLPETKQKELDSWLKTAVQNVFSGQLKVDFSPAMKNGMIIAPADGSYKLSFTDEDFANFFKSYLRPKAVQILFGE
jgi:V/A-type H+-transporting ATPase subunit E